MVVLLVGGYLVIFQIAPQVILSPRKITDQTLRSYFNEVPTPNGTPNGYEEFTISSINEVKLNGWFIHANSPEPKGTLVFLHGIGGSKEFFLSRAQRYIDQGMNVVLFDQRAHGKSTGDYCTYGYYEKTDVQELVKYIIAKEGAAPIGLYGTSLGGAVALQATAICSEVDFVVVESTFSTMEEVVFEYMKRLSGVEFKFISDWALAAAGRKASFDPDHVKPVDSSQRITHPALIIHGTKDEHIPISLGKRNFEALSSKDKTWLEIDGANHNNVYQIGGEAYLQKIDEFIQRQLK